VNAAARGLWVLRLEVPQVPTGVLPFVLD
jgi:hypothetical protein